MDLTDKKNLRLISKDTKTVLLGLNQLKEENAVLLELVRALKYTVDGLRQEIKSLGQSRKSPPQAPPIIETRTEEVTEEVTEEETEEVSDEY